MNKTQLAKLLIKHPEIKALYESRAFDTSTINKVIAEEIMNEQGEKHPFDKILISAIGRLSERTINLEGGQTISDWLEESYEGTTAYDNRNREQEFYYDYIFNALESAGSDQKKAHRILMKMQDQDPPKQQRQASTTSSSSEMEELQSSLADVKEEIEHLEQYLDSLTPEEQQQLENFRKRKKEISARMRAIRGGIKNASQQAIDSNSDDSVQSVAQVASNVSQELDSAVETVKNTEASTQDKVNAVDQAVQDAAETTNNDLDLSDIEIVDDAGAANASNDGEENAAAATQESTHLNIMKEIFTDTFETDYPILSKDEKFLELLAKAIADKRDVPAQAEEEEEAKPVNENQDDKREAEIQKMQAFLKDYEDGSLGGIDVAKIAKTAQSLKDKPSGFIELFKQVVSAAIAEKVADEIVDPILEKINTAATAGQVAGAASAAPSGGAGLLLVGLSLAGKFILGKAVEAGVSTVVEAGVKKLINEGLDLIPGIEEIENADAVFTEILGDQVFNAIQAKVKTGAADVESIKALVAANWKDILRNFIVVSTKGDLGTKLQKWSTGFMSYEISIPKFGQLPVGAMLSELIGFTPEQIASANNISDELEQARQKNPELAQAADEETGTETTDGTEDQTEPESLPPVVKGWSNAKAAANAIVKKEGMDIDQIRDGLEDIESFKELFNVRSNEEAKFAQAQKLFEDGYFAKRLEELSQQAATAENLESAPTEDIENLAATYMSYIDYLNALPQDQEFSLPADLQFPETIPADEQDFQQQFIEPIAPEGATVGTSTEDYIALGKQVIQQAGELLTDFADDEVVQRFLGWYVGERSKEIAGQSPQNLQEIHPDKDDRFAPFSSTILRYDDIKNFKKATTGQEDKWINIFEKLDELIKNGDISIDTPEPTEEPVEEPAQIPTVQEAEVQGKQDAEQDAQLPPLEFKEAYKDYKQILDGFFSIGSNDGFMDQFLLKYQSKKLWELIGTLTRIEAGVEGEKSDQSDGEMQAFTTTKDNVKAGVQKEGTDAFFKRDKKPEISKEARTELRTSLSGMLQAIKSLKAMMDSYRDNMTRSSANPKLDGSALKKSLMAYMENLQDNIASIIERCYIEQQRLTQLQTADVDNADESKPEVQDAVPQGRPFKSQQGSSQLKDLPSNEEGDLEMWEAIAPALDGIYLMEDAERDGKIKIVRGQYELMREEYKSNLLGALETTDRRAAMTSASTMLGHAKKEEFLSLFPSYLGTYKGKPVSIDDAIEAIQEIVKEFVETMKNVITLAKGQLLEENSLTKVIDDLGMLSQTIENYFGIKSKIPDDLKSKVEKLLAQRKENESLSDDAKPTGERSGELIDTAKDLAGKGLEKLKQIFGKLMDWLKGKGWNKLLAWFKQNKPEDLMPTGIEIDGEAFSRKIQQADSEEAALEIAQDLSDLGKWLNSLNANQHQALGRLTRIIKDNQPMSESQENAHLNLLVGFKKFQIDIRKQVIVKSFKEFRDKYGEEHFGLLMDTVGHERDAELAALFIAQNIEGLLKPSEETAPDLSEPSAKNSPAPAANDAADDSATITGDQSTETEDGNESPDASSIKTIDEIRKLLASPDSVDVGAAPPTGWSRSEYEVNSEPLISIIEAFGLDFEKDSQGYLLEQGVVEFARFAKILSFAIEDQDNVNEGFFKKAVKGVKDKILKRKIKKLFFEKAKFDAKSEAGKFLDSQLDPSIDHFLEALELGEKMQQNVIKLINSILINKGDLRKVAEESKNESASSGAFNRSEISNAKEAGQRMADTSPHPPLEEALKPIIEKMLKEHYNY